MRRDKGAGSPDAMGEDMEGACGRVPILAWHLPERVVDDRLHRGQDFVTLLLRYLVPVLGHRAGGTGLAKGADEGATGDD